jgi:hypothetical protein
VCVEVGDRETRRHRAIDLRRQLSLDLTEIVSAREKCPIRLMEVAVAVDQ